VSQSISEFGLMGIDGQNLGGPMGGVGEFHVGGRIATEANVKAAKRFFAQAPTEDFDRRGALWD
jgi:hypothetical protein